jgi:hypothetical protein
MERATTLLAEGSPARSIEGGQGIDQWQYVRHLGQAVAAAMRARGHLVREFSQLDQTPATALVRAGRIGARCAPAFEDARLRIATLPTPLGAQTIRDALLGWLDVHLQVCGQLVRAAGTRDPRHVGNAAVALRNAQPFAQRYNLARRRLAERLAA